MSSTTIQEIRDRKSMRAFTDEPVTPEDERTIIQAAIEAPSACNQQLFSIVIVRDQSKKERIAELANHQTMVAKAPLVLMFLADMRRWRRGYELAGENPRKPGPGDFMVTIEDVCIAAQNCVVAADALGYGSCYVGDAAENYEQMREVLDLPDLVFPVFGLIVGKPNHAALVRPKPARFPYEALVGEDSYKCLSDEELLAAYASKAETDDPVAFLASFHERKWASPTFAEMNRCVSVWMSQFED